MSIPVTVLLNQLVSDKVELQKKLDEKISENVALREELEGPKPSVINETAPGELAIGDYVFASRWSDCDPGDPWNVGHVSEIGDGFVVCGDVSPRRWPKAMRITKEQGARICAKFPILERTNPSDYAAIAEVFGVRPV